ncbi:MAG: YfcE family phosphodiesterase [Candidatus Krumholzibacteriota bacterium]|nr:YfcE family phosphodiesterase [Candidatus Krumholzibacteriota bacterium]
MKLTVVSDSHDHIQNLDRAMEMASQIYTSQLLHCGDLCSPFMVEHLARFRGDVHLVFGNNDGDRLTIARLAEKYPNVNIYGESGILRTGPATIAWTHLPEFGAGLAATGDFDAVFSGHTHRRKSVKAGKTWHINPGELMGLREAPGFATFDLETFEVEYYNLWQPSG